jgi:hypothetical protein
MASRSRRRMRPEFYLNFPPSELRAQGMPGARCARGLVCNDSGRAHTSIQVTPESPGIPHAMVLTVTPCSPRCSAIRFTHLETRFFFNRLAGDPAWAIKYSDDSRFSSTRLRTSNQMCAFDSRCSGSLATVTCATSRRLDTSVEVSGPHVFSVRLSAVRYRRIRVHRIPPRERDDRVSPLCWDGTVANIALTCISEKQNIFSDKG